MTKKEGFTLLEILLVIAIIAILAAIVIIAINPGKQLADSRNAQRQTDVNTILNATYQYTLDNNGTLPTTIVSSATCDSTAATEVCKTATCPTGTDLFTTLVSTTQKYLPAMAADPTGSSTNGTGYHIVKSTNGRLTVCAPSAEQGKTISVTR